MCGGGANRIHPPGTAFCPLAALNSKFADTKLGSNLMPLHCQRTVLSPSRSKFDQPDGSYWADLKTLGFCCLDQIYDDNFTVEGELTETEEQRSSWILMTD
eukprot:EG_transcript_65473